MKNRKRCGRALVTESLSAFCVATSFFRDWDNDALSFTLLHASLNHSNGKPATFTESELITLADALKDLSHKLLETSESIQRSI